MPFFYIVNTVSTELKRDVQPWEFKPTEIITEQIRKVKEDRQNWYNTASTRHHFYTAVEPVNPNLRPNKENNPPLYLHGFIADYDVLQLPEARVDEAIAKMELKPSWKEKSLGGNWRLVWVLETPMLVNDWNYCNFILQESIKWLRMDLLPELDAKAARNPTRTFCNGCVWQATGHGPIALTDSQAFLVRLGREYRKFDGGDDVNIPLNVVEKSLRDKYPAMNWPGDFIEGSQGPSFWIPESVSPLSAIVKSGGMYSFAAHAQKNFYTWTDLLGKEFTSSFENDGIAKATHDIWWDDNTFWKREKDGFYHRTNDRVLENFFKVDCHLGTKAGKDGLAPTDKARAHIYRENHICYAAPFVHLHPGFIKYQNKSVLNTCMSTPLEPAAGAQQWGPQGNFPFISLWLGSYFFDLDSDPEHPLEHFLAWCKVLFTAAHHWLPQPGQNLFIVGIPNSGKSLLTRFVVAPCAGGFIDARDVLVKDSQFNAHALERPIWCIDDDTAADAATVAQVSAMMKKLAANQDFLHHAKFQTPGMVSWSGRAIVTLNPDPISTRIMGMLDNNSMDKTNLYRCVSKNPFQFPSRPEVRAILERELPYFMRYVLDYQIPDYIELDSRYGIKPYHETSLVHQTQQSTSMAPFKVLLFETILNHFKENPEATEFKTNIVELTRKINANPMNSMVTRGMKLEQVNRYLDSIVREGILACHTETAGTIQARIWVFKRPNEATLNTPVLTNQTPTSAGNFENARPTATAPENKA